MRTDIIKRSAELAVENGLRLGSDVFLFFMHSSV